MTDDDKEGSDCLSYEDAQALIFGMDPCEWAIDLRNSLVTTAGEIHLARERNARKAAEGFNGDTTALRSATQRYLADILVRLQSLPLLQQEPRLLEQLRLILADIGDLDRGRTASWLSVKPDKAHLKRLEEETEWVPVVTAMEILMLQRAKTSEDGAARLLSVKTDRAIGTIKRWRKRIFTSPTPERMAARDCVLSEVNRVKAMLTLVPAEQKTAFILREVEELLAR